MFWNFQDISVQYYDLRFTTMNIFMSMSDSRKLNIFEACLNIPKIFKTIYIIANKQINKSEIFISVPKLVPNLKCH